MSTAYENLKKHLELAVRQLKEIKDQKKKFDVGWRCSQLIVVPEALSLELQSDQIVLVAMSVCVEVTFPLLIYHIKYTW